MGTLIEMKNSGQAGPQTARAARSRTGRTDRTLARGPAGRDSSETFEVDARRVLARLSRALRQLFENLPGPIERARHVQNVLGVDYTLAWRSFRLATADDPVSVGAEVPRPGPMKSLLDAAERKRVRAVHVQRVRRAYAAFEQLVRRHAGDAATSGRGGGKNVGGRAVFDSLIGSLNGDTAPKLEMVHRRAAFKSNSYLWGVQARTMLHCAVLHEGSSPEMIDGLMIGDFVGLHALRQNVPLRLTYRAVVFETSDSPDRRVPELVPGEPHLLEHFSSRPLPKLTSYKDPRGATETCMRFDRVGKAAAIDVFTAEVYRNANNGVPEAWHGMMKAVNVPCEVLLIDLLVQRGWTDPSTLRVSTHGNPALLETMVQRIPDFELPVKERAEFLGNDLQRLETPDVPRYPEMVSTLLGELGWSKTTFDIFRCRVQYPVMQTIVHMRVDTRSAKD